jgi:hypothetical protein
VTATLTAGTWRYALPPDYSGGHISIRDKTNDTKLSVVSPHQFDVLYPDPSKVTSTSGALVAAIKNLELWVMPPPGADVVELEYERSGDDITATDFSWLPEIERFRCCDFAIAESFAALQQWDSANYYYALWKEGTQKAKRSDGKRRYTTMGYRARSVFQA